VTTSELPALWRARADDIGRFAPAAGEAFRECAAELAAALVAAESELLTLEQGAKESGYTTDHLRHMLTDGRIKNAGARGRPRIRRGDLPKKAGAGDAPDAPYDPTQDAIDLEARRAARRRGKEQAQ
jgi:hypothetical protein